MNIKPYELQSGNCKELIKQLADNTIDAIVTDPPYELGFMGKKWDATGIAYDAELWRECLRVLKPGGHLLAFSGSRTYHRMAVAIEDAGFDIRDQIMWVYGSGFPKSHDVSKAIDKMAGAEREITGTAKRTPASHTNTSHEYGFGENTDGVFNITAPATDAAKEWNGWGTALKPAHEPICVARKPLIGTVAENVLEHGTGALNIDGCRVGIEGGTSIENVKNVNRSGNENVYGTYKNMAFGKPVFGLGRWPANLIHDGSAEVLAGFPETQNGGKRNAERQTKNSNEYETREQKWGYKGKTCVEIFGGDRGSAARFFYCAKASKRDRDEGCGGLDVKQQAVSAKKSQRYIDDVNCADGKYQASKAPSRNHHPTVKPTELMRYLCRLVTPPNGLILDPFTGSGSTGKAAILEGFRFVGFEMETQYIEIATARIEWALEQKTKQNTEQENTLFGASNE